MHTNVSTHKLTFSEAAKPYLDRGFPIRDLLPVIPPNAKLWADSKVKPEMCGKVPGRFVASTGEWTGLGGTWPVEGLNPGLKPAKWPTGNVGLRAASWPAIDVDVESAEVRDMVEEVIGYHLGLSPVRERANAPRSLLVFKLSGDEPARKIRVVFELQGARHAVELLAAGQQYLVCGTHPSGHAYYWRDGADLSSWGVEGLSVVTAEELRSTMRAITDEVLRLGGRIVSETKQRMSEDGAGVHVMDVDPAFDTDIALAALRAVPNTLENFPAREEFVAQIAAFKAATGRDAENYKDEVCKWATEEGACDYDYFTHVWNSLDHVKTPADALLRRARRAGWHGDAAADFGPVTENEERAIKAARTRQDDDKNVLEAAAKRIVYWPSQQSWIMVGTGEFLSHGALNNHTLGLQIAPAGASGQKTAAATLRNSGLVRDVIGTTYYPGRGQLFDWSWQGRSGLYFNRWHGHRIPEGPPSDITVTPWWDHVCDLFPNEDERNHMLQWMAFVVQKPGVKVRWAPMIFGGQGVGKDLMFRPLVWAVGEHNVTEISPQTLMDKWTGYYEHQIVIVQEMQRIDKTDAYERVKAAITGTGANILMVEKKYEPAYPVPNTVAFLFMTNHEDAIALAPDDRRFFVIECARNTPREPAYYNALAEWYERGGIHEVARYLATLDVSGFKADQAPEWTMAKRNMMEQSLPQAAKWCMDSVLEEGVYADRTVLTVGELVSHVRGNLSLPHDVREYITSKQVALGLRAAGWVKANNGQVRIKGGRARLWVKNATLAGNPPTMLAARFAQESKTPLDFDEGMEG